MVTEIKKTDMETGSFFSEKLCVIMFYGVGCNPCTFTMPHYEEAAKKYLEKTNNICFYKIHAWDPENEQYCKEYWNIDGVPCFKLIFNNQILGVNRSGGCDLLEMMKLIHEGIDEVFRLYGEKI